MRQYEDKKNRQKQEYYTDRFKTPQRLARVAVENDEVFKADVESLSKKVEIKEAYIEAGQLVIWIRSDDNLNALKFLKNKLFYNNLSEMSAVDFLAQRGEFEIFYQMLSMKKRKRIRVKCVLKENEVLKSVVSAFKSADWAERETYDMFGVTIINHPYMKRLLMPDDWSGYPLRKSYPLHGDEAAQWYEIDQIYGKEYRDLIGPEIRDSAQIDKEDTCGYARMGYEVGYGEAYSQTKSELGEYQEEGGVTFVKKFKKGNSVILKKRR